MGRFRLPAGGREGALQDGDDLVYFPGVPVRRALAGGEAVFEQQRPEIAARPDEFEITGEQPTQVRSGVGAHFGAGQFGIHIVECLTVDMDNEIVEIFKEVIQRAGGIADPVGDVSRGQRAITVRFDNVPRGIQREFVKLFPGVIRSASHSHPRHLIEHSSLIN